MNVTPLGQYLLREVPEAAEYVCKALAIQATMASSAEYRNIGDILLDRGWITPRPSSAVLSGRGRIIWPVSSCSKRYRLKPLFGSRANRATS